MTKLPFLSLLALGLAVAHSHAQALPTAEYGIKQVRPSLGTNIRRLAVKTDGIPINRRYAELTAEEKARVRAPYEGMPAGDEPPYPADGLAPLFDALRSQPHYLQVRGPMRLIAMVDSQGVAKSIEVLASPNSEVTSFVSKQLTETRFKPALCQGQPCRMEYLLYLQFNADTDNQTEMRDQRQ